MSHNRIVYRIYADDQSPHTNEEWKNADRHINGLAYSGDKNEAFAIAKKAAKNCQYPFVVLAVPVPKNNGRLCDAWVIDA